MLTSSAGLWLVCSYQLLSLYAYDVLYIHMYLHYVLYQMLMGLKKLEANQADILGNSNKHCMHHTVHAEAVRDCVGHS